VLAVVLRLAVTSFGGEEAAEAQAWLDEHTKRIALFDAYRDAMLEGFGAQTAITEEIAAAMSASAEATALTAQSEALGAVETGKLRAAFSASTICSWVNDTL
jgi:hypothetical protein